MRQSEIASLCIGLLAMAVPTGAQAQAVAPVGSRASDGSVPETAPPEPATVPCPADGMDHCFQVPGVAIPPEAGDRREILPSPPLWSLSVSGGLSPRDGGATGAYGAVELRRQIGHGYVQVGGMRYHTPLLSDAVSAASTFNVGTLAGGVNLNNWLLDGYVSYGWQDFGAVRVDDGSGQTTLVRPSNAATKGSPYYGAGISLGRMIPVNNRIFITPTAAVVYAWGRWLHPAGSIPRSPARRRSSGRITPPANRPGPAPPACASTA
jgi:hypothetical protein